ncbi:MAG: hypothetical protein M0Z66_16855 [Thermaerobacter sp.]|nr:hypothetical protein [Thermaerobacter sp.]
MQAFRPMRIMGAFGKEAFPAARPNGDRVQYTATLFACAAAGTAPHDPGRRASVLFACDEMPASGLADPQEILRPIAE